MRTLAVIIATSLSLVAQSPKKPLKVFISVDMEGITGVMNGDHTAPSPDFNAARKWMASDVNAAVQGALDAGATEVVVADGHGQFNNLQLQDLHPKATLVTGRPRPFGMMEGIDKSFDAVFFVGYHARAGTPDGVLNHTISGGTVASVSVNGKELPEVGLNALIAGHYGVPVVFLSGDVAISRQAKELFGPGFQTAIVKTGIGAYAAHTLGLEAAQAAIREGARKSLTSLGTLQPFRMEAPYRVELTFLRTTMADGALRLPMASRTGSRSVAFESSSIPEAYRLISTVISLASN